MPITPVVLWRTITAGLRRLVNNDRADVEINDEMQHYIDQATREGIARGLAPHTARREAQMAFGNTTQVKEGVRMSLWESSITTFLADTRYALRMLRRTPVFTAVIVLVISLGTGAVTTIFSAANSYLLRPLPGTTNTSRLVQIDRISANGNEGSQSSYPYYTYLRDNTHTMQGVAAWSKVDLTLSPKAGGVSAYGNIVSGNFFSVLGVRPALGRFFLPEEDKTPLAHPVVVVSHDFWLSHLAGDSAAIGQTIGVNGHPYTLIGVAPQEFHGVFTPLVVSAWVPLAMQPWLRSNRDIASASTVWLWMFGRMNDNVSAPAVRQELLSLTASLPQKGAEPDWLQGYTNIRLIALTGLPDDAHKAMLAFLGVLLAAALMVLLIASVNVAAMLSARALARRREMALRLALGAQRSRIVRQLLTESLVLFVFGAIGGITITYAATRALEQLPLPVSDPLTLELSPDLRVLAFALAVSLATGVIFGLAPALRSSRQDVTSRLRDDTQGSDSRRTVVSNVLVVGQLALSLVLLVSAGLLLRALDHGNQVNPGFDAKGVVTAPFSTEAFGYDSTRARLFFAALRERVSALPGVTDVSYTSILPLNLSSSGTRIQVDANAVAPDARGKQGGAVVQTASVDYDYFSAVHIPLVQGSAIKREDNATSGKVAIVNETLAKRAWPKGNALGSTFHDGKTQYTVTGIARDAKYASLSEETPGFVYYPMAQEWRADQNLLVRSRDDGASMAPLIQQVVHSIDTALPVPAVITLEKSASFSLLPQRVAAIVAGSLGLVGLLLATVGLYGIISYSVSRRTREIGIRMALGAQRTDVQRIVVREGMRLAGLGVVIGVVLAAAASRLLSSYLYGVSPLDLFTFTAMPATFVCVALLASYFPARRASRSDPMIALRSA